jgi:hypothetical protein
VKSAWVELDMKNMSIHKATTNDLNTIIGCAYHKGCKGHHMTNPDSNAFLIPQGFATPDEFNYNEAAALNLAVFNGVKTSIDMANFCFGRFARKNGILRKQCNSTRPTNTCRFVASPSLGPKDTIYVPNEVFDKGVFLTLGKDGRYKSCKLKEGDVVLFGRNPSQGSDSALPMRVRRTSDKTMRVPVDVCSKNNTDFDGDEDWFLVAGCSDAREQIERALVRVWDGTESIFEKVGRLVDEAGGDSTIDSPRLNPSRQPNSEAARSAITTASVFARQRWGWLCLDQQYHHINAANTPTKIAPNSVAFRHTYLLAPTAGLQALINTKDGTKDYRRNCLVRRDCILHSYR